jgi:hypothetical protein
MAGWAPLSNLSGGFTFAGTVVAALGAASAQSRLALLLPAGLFTWTVVVGWSGSGRLAILQLTVALLLVFCYRTGMHRRVVKWAVALAVVPALAIGGLVEINRRTTERGLLTRQEDFAFGDGLSSMKSPLLMLGQILEGREEDAIPLHWFETFFATLVLPIPRSLWAQKPDGFGRELARNFNYEKWATSGHSDAALLPAEFVWGFGLAGLLVGVPLIVFLLRIIDTGLDRYAGLVLKPGEGRLAVVPWSILSAGVLSLWWAGTFTFWARTSLALIGVVFLYLVAWILTPARPNTQPLGPQPETAAAAGLRPLDARASLRTGRLPYPEPGPYGATGRNPGPHVRAPLHRPDS